MDQRKCEEGGQNVLDFKCKKILPVVEKSTAISPAPKKPGIVSNLNLETEFASRTPEKIYQPLRTKFKEGEVELPQRYKTIAELFDSMACSLSLLSLRKLSPTFQNIYTQVEVLTNRKFYYRHLAQIKYILPEAIQIDKTLVHDKKTLCMKPDMKIMLLFDVIEGHNEQSEFIALRQVFASRLINYFTTYPEDHDIPEAMLPDPFNKSKQTALADKVGNIPEAVFHVPVSQTSQRIAPESMLANSLIEHLPTTGESELLSKPSHLCSSFSRHFSQKVFVAEREKTQMFASQTHLSSVPYCSPNDQDTEVVRSRELPGLNSKVDTVTNLDIKSKPAKESPGTYSNSTLIDSLPVQLLNPQLSVDGSACASSPWKPVSSTDSLMTKTPTQPTPKRPMPSPDDKHEAMASQKQISFSKPTKRFLDFSYLVGDKHNITESVDGSPALPRKEEESLGCPGENHKMSQSDIMDQYTPVCLPDLVLLIHHIFQSVNYSPITKEELVYKIVINNLDFLERREVEEHIELLENLVPDWICRKLAPSGDALYNIKKMPDLDSVQARVISI